MPPIDRHRLRLAMELRGLNARQLAEATGAEALGFDEALPPITEQYVSMILAGRRNVARSAETRERLASALDVPVDWIEEGPPTGDELVDRIVDDARRQRLNRRNPK